MFEGCKFEVLHLANDDSDLNDTSIVLRGLYGENSFLFMGDATAEVEKKILDSNIDSDVLKVGHHGSNYSNGSKWFEYLKPEYIVVSCSKRNLYGHPGKKAVERMEASGAKIFYTMEGGQITFPLIQ